MADKKFTDGAQKGAPPPLPRQGPNRASVTKADADSPYLDMSDGEHGAADRFGRILIEEKGPRTDASGIEVGHKRPAKRMQVNALAPEQAKQKVQVPFRGRAGQSQAAGKTGKEPARRDPQGQDVASKIAAARIGLKVLLHTSESINSAKLHADALQSLRRALEPMDDAERKQTIAALMAYIGELQTSGALESVPSDRLARVAKLIGQAAEVVSADPASYIPLFRDRERDAKTGKLPTAIEWYNAHWSKGVEAGAVDGSAIREIDAQFYGALISLLSKRGQKFSDLVPSRAPMSETERQKRRRATARDGMRRLREKRTPTG